MNAISMTGQFFPPHLPIVWNPHLSPFLAEAAAMNIPHVGPKGFGPCWAMGVKRNDALAAVVVFHSWQRDEGTVQVSIVARSPRWATRQIIAALLRAVFNGCLGEPVRIVWAAIPSTNVRSQRFCKGIGFKREAILRDRFAEKVHAMIYSMKANEFRKRYPEDA